MSERLAYVMAASEEPVTYGELDRRSSRLAQLFRARGLRVGDGVAILMENHPRFLEVAWAAQRAGLYYTAIGARLGRDEAAHVLADCGARALISSTRLHEVAAAAAARAPAVETKLICGRSREGFESYEAAVASHPAEPIADETQGMDLLYSSGTTGRPKGVRFALPGTPAGSLTSFDRLVSSLYGMDGDGVYLSPAPLYHAAPLRFSISVLRLRGTVVVMDRFDPEGFLDAVSRHRVTHAQVVPTMLVRLLELEPERRRAADLHSLRCLLHAGAPCPPSVKEAALEWLGPIVHEYYAGTERNGFVAASPQEWLQRPGTVGRAVVGKVHVVGDDGQELPPGETGTVYFEGGNEFEYLNDPEQTAASRDRRGWTTMGDLGRLDEDGYLYLADRQAHVIISGGVNVYPKEVEDVLARHREVLDVAVLGLPHPDMGEEVRAVVQPAEIARAGPELETELISFCRERLAGYKCPRAVRFIEMLPREETGKLRKHRLREWLDDRNPAEAAA